MGHSTEGSRRGAACERRPNTPQVDLQVAGSGVSFVTLTTRIWLGASVNELVALSVRVLLERLIAVLALERLFSRVGSHMDLRTVVRVEPRPTNSRCPKRD